MPLVRSFGAWTSGGPVAAPPPTSPPPAPSSGGGWTGHACTPENPCTYQPLPMIPGGPGQPTTASWSLNPGQAPPAPGTGWQGDPVPLPPPAPPPSNVSPFMPQPSPAIGYGGSYTPPAYQPPGSSAAPAPAPPKLFGLPPLVVIGAGGLLIFLVVRRLSSS